MKILNRTAILAQAAESVANEIVEESLCQNEEISAGTSKGESRTFSADQTPNNTANGSEKTFDGSKHVQSTRPTIFDEPEHQTKPYLKVQISESELEVIMEESVRAGSSESGCTLYGYYNRQGEPVILLAQGPGENAKHGTAWFQQDIEQLLRTQSELMAAYGVDYLGRQHNHPNGIAPYPSSIDTRSACSFTYHNNFRNFVEIITEVKTVTLRNRYNSLLTILFNPKQISKTSAHVYIYPEPGKPEFISCPLHIIPGVSPIRQALCGDYESC